MRDSSFMYIESKQLCHDQRLVPVAIFGSPIAGRSFPARVSYKTSVISPIHSLAGPFSQFHSQKTKDQASFNDNSCVIPPQLSLYFRTTKFLRIFDGSSAASDTSGVIRARIVDSKPR